tara:strand:+ start:177 stop:530 length:354 start_codon:yes stop_codon:yes gene_type:complete
MTWSDIAKEIMQTQSDIARHGAGKVMQPTSRWARMSVDAMSIKQKILCELKITPATDDELEQRLEMRHQSVSSCRRGCVKNEWVQPTGDTRPTRSGRLANVWELTATGVAEVAKILQ